MKIEQSLNNPDSWQVTADNGSYVLGFISRLPGGQYEAFGPKLHSGKGGIRRNVGSFQTLNEASQAIEEANSKYPTSHLRHGRA